MSLQNEIDEMNIWANHTGTAQMDINSLSVEEAQSIYIHIDTGLSPENLHCDGKISCVSECNQRTEQARISSAGLPRILK